MDLACGLCYHVLVIVPTVSRFILFLIKYFRVSVVNYYNFFFFLIVKYITKV